VNATIFAMFGSDDLARAPHSSARIGTCYIACMLYKGPLNNDTTIAIVRPPYASEKSVQFLLDKKLLVLIFVLDTEVTNRKMEKELKE
jgi:hypothetical protein